MSFSDILTRWYGAGETAEADLGIEILNVFQSEFTQAFANIDADSNISDSARESLLQEWVNNGSKVPTEIESAFDDFCRNGKKKAGPLDRTAQGSTLGHTMTRRKLENWFGSAGSPTSPLTLGTGPSLAPSVDRFLRDDVDTQRRKLPRTPPPMPLMWSFYDPSSIDDPFRLIGENKIHLHDRLGLGHIGLSTNDLLIFAHKLTDDIQAHTPTTFDAEISEYYRPGGITEPLTGSYGPGMPEVIHDPVSRAHLLQRIRETV